MARKKTPKVRVNIKASLSRRLREIRQELFGEHGGPELARRLNLPARTWYNYETGVTVPAEVLLSFIEQTGTNPAYLITGEGSRYRPIEDERVISQLTPVELIRRGLEKLERANSDVMIVAPDNLPNQLASDFTAVGLYPMNEITRPVLDPSQVEGYVMAYRQWLPNPSRTIATRITNDAMSPVLAAGSIVAIDRSMTDPTQLNGKIVAACPSGSPVIRWLEISGRHAILRPNIQSRNYPLVLIDLDDHENNVIVGQVVWSWSRFIDG